MEALPPSDRLTLMVKLFEFELPKQKDLKIDAELKEQPLFISEIRTYEGLPDFYFDEESRKINPKDIE